MNISSEDELKRRLLAVIRVLEKYTQQNSTLKRSSGFGEQNGGRNAIFDATGHRYTFVVLLQIACNMYGLILENMAEYIKQTYGEDKWEEIRRAAAVEQPSFSTHQVYSEALIPRLAKKAIQV